MNMFNPQAYWEERLGRNIGLSGVGYIGMGESFNGWLYRVRRQVFSRVISLLHVNVQELKVIDIGSGSGFYIERWREMKVQTLVGTDLTRVSVDHLRKKFPEDQFLQIDIASPLVRPLQEDSYDIATAFDVLFHIVDDPSYQRAIQNIYTILKPGGWFIFSDNFLHGKTERGLHQVSRSLEDITGCLEKCGFKIVRRLPMFFLMNDPIDQTNFFLRRGWQMIFGLFCRINAIGFLWGMALYPVELFLTRYLRESPTTEMMVCRKPE